MCQYHYHKTSIKLIDIHERFNSLMCIDFMVLNTTVMTCVCERYSFITVIADSNVNFQVVRQFLFAFQVPKPKQSADFTSEFTQKSLDCSIQR